MKDDLVETYDIYFERSKEHATFLYPGMDLSSMGIFKVLCDGQLVDVSGGSQPSDLVASPAKGIETDPEVDKEIEDANMVETSLRDALEEKLASEDGQ